MRAELRERRDVRRRRKEKDDCILNERVRRRWMGDKRLASYKTSTFSIHSIYRNRRIGMTVIANIVQRATCERYFLPSMRLYFETSAIVDCNWRCSDINTCCFVTMI